METLDDLRQEVDRRVADGHPAIIIEVLDQLLQELSRASTQDHGCSYFIHFQFYRKIRTRLTLLHRVFSYESGSPASDIFMRISNLNKAVAEIRDLRYIRVCKKCSACLTRHKRWPANASFIS